MSQREIGEVIGVDPATVNRDVANATAGKGTINEGGAEQATTVANATPDPAVQRKIEAAAVEENKRETMIRLTEAAPASAENSGTLMRGDLWGSLASLTYRATHERTRDHQRRAALRAREVPARRRVP